MAAPRGYMVFDVESVGLHGDAFAVAWVLATQGGKIVGEGAAHIPTGYAEGSQEGRDWIEANVTIPLISVSCESARAMRDLFWEAWTQAKTLGFALFAECLWPVEARFLSQCIADDPEAREWKGPYPFHDIASIRFRAGRDPLAIETRLPDELPAHNPLADARQSLRLLVDAMS